MPNLKPLIGWQNSTGKTEQTGRYLHHRGMMGHFTFVLPATCWSSSASPSAPGPLGSPGSLSPTHTAANTKGHTRDYLEPMRDRHKPCAQSSDWGWLFALTASDTGCVSTNQKMDTEGPRWLVRTGVTPHHKRLFTTSSPNPNPG